MPQKIERARKRTRAVRAIGGPRDGAQKRNRRAQRQHEKSERKCDLIQARAPEDFAKSQRRKPTRVGEKRDGAIETPQQKQRDGPKAQRAKIEQPPQQRQQFLK